MVDVIPSLGPLTEPLELVRKLIASCAAWQALFGAASVEAAAEYVYLEDVDETADPAPTRPLAIVRYEDWENSKIALATFSPHSVLEFAFEIPVTKFLSFWQSGFWPAGFWPAGFWPEVTLGRTDQFKLFTNFVGRMLTQMAALQQTDADDDSGLTHIDLTTLRLVAGPGRVEINDDIEEHFGVTFSLGAGGE